MNEFKIQMGISVNKISAERLLEMEEPMPQGGRIDTDLNIMAVNKKREDVLEVSFAFTINYRPTIAQISLRGKAQIRGTKEEILKIYSTFIEKKFLPPQIFQPIFSFVFTESILITRTLNVPPPISQFPQFQPAAEQKKPSEPTYRA